MKILSKVLLVAVTLQSMCPALASTSSGVDSSGGGDNLPSEAGSAWFLGAAPIRYCFKSSIAFGLDDRTIGASIEKAILKWRDYLANYAVGGFYPDGVNLDLNFTPLAHCDGSEDLRFLFGTRDRQVTLARSKFVKPSFFAYREAYDTETGRGKGFIWIAPAEDVHFVKGAHAWTDGLLETAIQHEIGHVLGCAHIDNTIMRQEIASDFQADEPIDGGRMLVLGNHIRQVHKPSLEPASRNLWASKQWSDDIRKTFDKFTGKESQGEISQEIDVKWNIDKHKGEKLEVTITLTSGGTSHKVMFTPTLDTQGQLVRSGYATWSPEIFKVAYKGKVASEAFAGTVINGNVHDASGKAYPATLELNMNSTKGYLVSGSLGPIGLFYIEDNQKRSLFY
jgi:hypothetical protein